MQNLPAGLVHQLKPMMALLRIGPYQMVGQADGEYWFEIALSKLIRAYRFFPPPKIFLNAKSFSGRIPRAMVSLSKESQK